MCPFFLFFKACFVALFVTFGIDLERHGNIFMRQHLACPNDIRTLMHKAAIRMYVSNIIQGSGFDACRLGTDLDFFGMIIKSFKGCSMLRKSLLTVTAVAAALLIQQGCTPEEQAFATGAAMGGIVGGMVMYDYPYYYDRPYYYYHGRYYYGGYYRHGCYFFRGYRYCGGHYYHDGWRYHNGRRYRARVGQYGYYPSRRVYERYHRHQGGSGTYRPNGGSGTYRPGSSGSRPSYGSGVAHSRPSSTRPTYRPSSSRPSYHPSASRPSTRPAYRSASRTARPSVRRTTATYR